MLIIPAIDILDKKVVRLYQGRKDRIFFYSASPLEKIKEFSSLGIKLCLLYTSPSPRDRG